MTAHTHARTWYEAFLGKLGKTGNVSSACRTAKISRTAAYNARDDDPEFAAAWEEALEESCDRLEAEARRRAYTGVLKPVFQGGKEVGKIREYSDTLLILLLKAHRPKKFRENVDVTSGDKPLGLIQTIEVIAPADEPSDDGTMA